MCNSQKGESKIRSWELNGSGCFNLNLSQEKKNKKQKLHVHAYTSDKPVSIYQDPLHKHKTLYKPINKPN